MRRVLLVTAHPDDESGNFGGTIAYYLGRSPEIEFRLICLTAGGAGRHRGGAPDAPALMNLRRQELADACRLLGIQQHAVWDLPDAGLPQTAFYSTVGRLVGELRRYRPHLVLTMGPEGSVTAHPDHAMAGVFATSAFHWAAHDRFFPEFGLAPYQALRLYYATAAMQPPRFPPVFLPFPDVAIPIADFLDRKIEAFHCHRTQAPLFERVEGFLRSLGASQELFHLASGIPLPPLRVGSPLPNDLFAGLAPALLGEAPAP